MLSVNEQLKMLESQLKDNEQAVNQCIEELLQSSRLLDSLRMQRHDLTQKLQTLSQPAVPTTPVASVETPVVSAAPDSETPSETLNVQEVSISKAQRQAQLEYRDLVLESSLFDAKWYLETYPDVSAVSRYAEAPYEHYLMFGGFEGRNPGPAFDSAYYLALYPDVSQAGSNPLVHFLRFGQKEGRRMAP